MKCINVQQLFPQMARLVPPLSRSAHKGQAGKVAVIGGCQEYTGAPYFASYSALMVGADLSHVFCETSASTVIKTYSPELIVHPYLTDCQSQMNTKEDLAGAEKDRLAEEAVDKIAKWLPKFDAVVVGPGLGRDPIMISTAKQILLHCKERDMPVILDADGISLIVESPELAKNYSKAVLTPNPNEFRKLASALNVQIDNLSDSDALADVAKCLQGPAIIRKGGTDLICQDDVVVSCDEPGALRRCGGQGDVLAGCLVTYLAWASKMNPKPEVSSTVVAAALACLVTRKAAAYAFQKHRRSMRATCVIDQLGLVMDTMFDACRVQE